MTDPPALAREIERLRRRYARLLEETPRAREAPAVWELTERTLCWRVVLNDALEPDVDVEVLEEVIVVRAALERTVRQSLLPVPAPFRAVRPRVEFRAGLLEIRVTRGG